METLAWEVFEEHMRGAIPVALKMGGTRGVRIGFNPTSQSMFIRLPINPRASIPPNPYVELAVKILKDETGSVLEITTTTDRLFREFHRFAGIITEDFEEPRQTAVGAFETAIHRWRELISRKGLLTDEQQLGLQGELAFLRALLRVHGPQSVLAWTGRNQSFPERHDFRIGTIEIEIKSTRSSHRHHIIHGLSQLQASASYKLYIFSIRFESAGVGGGRSLCDEIKDIRLTLGNAELELKEFNGRLLASGFRDEEAEHYQKKLILADLPMLIAVDDSCPRITRQMISNELPSELAARIDDLSYRVNLEGIGFMQDSEEFITILGKIRLDN